MYLYSDIKPNTVWIHKATNSEYLVLGVARCSTNGPREGVEQSVVYYSLAYQRLCYRDINEFCDGSFMPKPPKMEKTK